MAPPRFRYHTNQLGFKRRVLLRRPPKPQPSLCDDASDKTGVTRDSGTAEPQPKKPRTRVYASTIVCSWRTGCSYDPYGRAYSMSLGPNKAIARALDGPRRGVQFQRREPRIRAPSMLSIQSTDVLCVIRILYALYTYSICSNRSWKGIFREFCSVPASRLLAGFRKRYFVTSFFSRRATVPNTLLN